ncbi:MAG: dTDP-4-dehydrorhamnose 3,5-epimerase [Candidatus Hydrogenedentes bacterium]|nr:dTDP-4-dehydrorhamnose 3,5-epimerase [Candidatus Hydrogenedentota bacterium]
MEFRTTAIPGAYIISPEPLEDDRGFFARTWCDAEFAAMGEMPPRWVQCNISFNRLRGTLRGMHLQAEPHGEEKLVRCTAGAIHDVIVDLRRDSPAYLHSVGVELSAQNRRMIYIPRGVAHGFLTLADATEVFYQMGNTYVAEAARGYRYDDPAFGIAWPGAVEVISPRDAGYADYAGGGPGS